MKKVLFFFATMKIVTKFATPITTGRSLKLEKNKAEVAQLVEPLICNQ